MTTIINDFDAEGKRQCRAPFRSGPTEVWTGITCSYYLSYEFDVEGRSLFH